MPDQQPNPVLNPFDSGYALAFAHMEQGFCLLEKMPIPPGATPDFRYRLINPALEHLLGGHPTVGQTIRQAGDQLQVHPLNDYEQVALTGQALQREHYVAAIDRWLEINVFRVRQQLPAWIGVLWRDITPRKIAQDQYAFLLKLTDALRPLADPSQIQQTALQILGQHLQVDRVLYAEVEADQAHFVITANYVHGQFPPMRGRFRLSDFGQTPDSQRRGQTLVLADIHQAGEAEEHLRSYLAAGVVSIIGVPLRKAGRWVASLTVHHGRPRQWTAQEVALVEETAERTWAALERARAEQALADSEKRLRLAIEATELGTWEWHLPTNQVYWNEQHFRLFGMSPQPQPLAPETFMSHVHPDERDRITRLLQKAITERSVYDAEFCAVLEDGSQRWMSGYGRVVEEREGQPLRMSGVMFDVDQRRRAEDELRQMNQRKDAFLALLAHELRNPIATLSNAVLLLEATGGSDEQLPLEVISPMMSRELQYLTRLVDDLLDISRINLGKLVLRWQRLELTDLLRQVEEASRPLIEQAHQQFRLVLPQTPLAVAGDLVRLKQVFRNLLGNASKFTPADGVITLSLESHDHLAIVRVVDTGVGLAGEALSRIFDQFVQLDQSHTRSQAGLGLGLTLVQAVIRLHNGRVEVHSPGLGQGSTFTVYLPLLT